jgi:transcriptional regulator with XRE-family HTH domain
MALRSKCLIRHASDFEPKSLGDHIKRARLSRRLTQALAAQAMGVGPITILNWEKGKTEPSIEHIPAIQLFLGYDPFDAPTNLSERMLAHRRACGWSMAEAARHIAVDEGTWRAWEAGETILRRCDREHIARTLGVSVASVHAEMSKRWNEAHDRSKDGN